MTTAAAYSPWCCCYSSLPLLLPLLGSLRPHEAYWCSFCSRGSTPFLWSVRSRCLVFVFLCICSLLLRLLVLLVWHRALLVCSWVRLPPLWSRLFSGRVLRKKTFLSFCFCFCRFLEWTAQNSGAEVGLTGRVAARHGPRAQRKHQGLPGGLRRRPAPPPAVAAGEARVRKPEMRRFFCFLFFFKGSFFFSKVQ